LKSEQKLEQQEDIQELTHRDENAILIHHKGLLIRSLIVLVGVTILFSLQTITYLEVSIIAIGGAAILLRISRVSLEKILYGVHWATLLFFIVICYSWHCRTCWIDNGSCKSSYRYDWRRSWDYLCHGYLHVCIASAFVDNIPSQLP
jgi:hypothetical protein